MLPPSLRILGVVVQHGGARWLNDALAADSACQVQMDEAVGATTALAKLREEVYDAIVVSHVPGRLDALEFVEGLRAGGAEEPVLILGDEDVVELTCYAFEAGADAYLCLHNTATRTLIWTLARAVNRYQLIRENRRLAQGERQRLQHEHQETDRLLDQQRSLIRNLEILSAPLDEESETAPVTAVDANRDFQTRWSNADTSALSPLPAQLVAHYRELLRAHVIMGHGNLAGELTQLAEMLTTAEITAEQTMLLHLQALEELVRGLGARSARHVMTRADLLILEVMIHLADNYRQRLLPVNSAADKFIPANAGPA